MCGRGGSQRWLGVKMEMPRKAYLNAQHWFQFARDWEERFCFKSTFAASYLALSWWCSWKSRTYQCNLLYKLWNTYVVCFDWPYSPAVLFRNITNTKTSYLRQRKTTIRQLLFEMYHKCSLFQVPCSFLLKLLYIF